MVVVRVLLPLLVRLAPDGEQPGQAGRRDLHRALVPGLFVFNPWVTVIHRANSS